MAQEAVADGSSEQLLPEGNYPADIVHVSTDCGAIMSIGIGRCRANP